MKLRFLAATGAAAALVAGSLLAAAPATAKSDDIVNVYGDITAVEGDSYPAGWFLGKINPPATAGTATASADGLVVTGTTQLLNGTKIPVRGGEAFTALATNAAIDLVSGQAVFQIPVFFNTADNELSPLFTTLRPADPGTPKFETQWISSRDISFGTGEGTINIQRNTPYPASTFADAFEAAVDREMSPTILAFGIFVNDNTRATVNSITFAGTTYVFRPAPTTELEPAPVPQPVKKDATFTG